MKAIVKTDACIGCEQCAVTCPKVFKMHDNIAEAITADIPADAENACRETAADCPVEAIEITI